MSNVHTPGPWLIGERRAKGQEVLIDSRTPDGQLGYTSWAGLAVAYGCDESPEIGARVAMANARRIVQCVNSHDALLYALKLMYANSNGCGRDEIAARLVARAAIASAEQQSPSPSTAGDTP